MRIIPDQASPSKLLEKVNAAYPGIWLLVDRARAMKGTDLPDWPDNVFLPYAAWYSIAGVALGKSGLDVSDMGVMQILAAVGTWRTGQDVVRFDAEVYHSIREMEPTGDIPADMFKRLPAWCLYVETPGLEVRGEMQAGFFVLLENDANTHEDELRLNFFNGESIMPVILHMREGMTVDNALEETGRQARDLKPEFSAVIDREVELQKIDAGIRTAVDLVLYLCAYGLPGRPEGLASFPQPKRTKKGWRFFPPDRPSVHVIGTEIGDALRDAMHRRSDSSEVRATGTHASPRPHIRRAHWHGYWSGPMAGPRRFDLKWLPPMAVALQGEKE